ncbi:MAG: hypothetical protein IJC86_04230 [Clostridia bacterium]|nr:hypothetical protein [Clostridia bacterium]
MGAKKAIKRCGGTSHLQSGADMALPLILISSVILSLSYIADLLNAGATEAGIGETSSISQFLYGIGSIISDTVYPLIAAGVAVSICGRRGFWAGITGGILTGSGVTLSYPLGDFSAMSGLWGSVAIGFAAGRICELTDGLLLSKERKSGILTALSFTLSFLLTAGVAIVLDNLCYIINIWSSSGLAVISRVSFTFVALLLGIMMNADVSGPMYLAGYIFGTASISTGDPEIMASVMATAVIPPISIGLCALVFRSRFTEKERYCAYIGLLCGICGITQSAVYHYLKRPLRTALPCIVGGVVASMLSMMFQCSVSLPAGGLLIIGAVSNPLYFLLSVLCGVFTATTIMGLLLRPAESHKESKTEDTQMQTQSTTA